MDDLISRRAAIEDLQGKDPSQIWDTADIEVWINSLPSAPPEVAKDTNVPSTDCISRQAAIDAIDEVMNNREIDSIRNAILAIRYKISALPNEDDWTKDYVARLKLRGDNPLRCYGDYFDGAKYINIDTSAKNDTRDYGAYWYE